MDVADVGGLIFLSIGWVTLFQFSTEKQGMWFRVLTSQFSRVWF
jgi:hypothetical protein